MLQNNIAALARVQTLDRDALLIVLARYKDVVQGAKVVAALKNAEADSPLTCLPDKNPAGITAGISAVAKTAGVQTARLILPEGDTEAEEKLRVYAAEMGITLSVDYSDHIDATRLEGNNLWSISELVSLADMLCEFPETALLTIDDGTVQEVLLGTPMQKLLPAGAKAYVIGHTFHVPEVRNRTVSRDLCSYGCTIRTIPQDACIVQEGLQEVQALRKLSCGRCTLCREGLYQHYRIFDGIGKARSKRTDTTLLNELAEEMADSATCSVGELAGKTVLSVVTNFSAEISSHMDRRICPAGACTAFIEYYIEPATCQGCGKCAEACPKQCITVKKGYTSFIESYGCTKCGKCVEICPNGSIHKTIGTVPKTAERPQRLKGVDTQEDAAPERSRTGPRRRHARDRQK